MEVDFDSVDDVSDFVTIPPGTYVCEVAEVRVGTTRNGDPRWAMRLVVAEGEFVGRQAAWDGLVFSTRGRARVRRVLGAMGIQNRGKVEIRPEDIERRRVVVEVRPAAFDGPNGETIRRNEVPYDGYRPLPEGDAGKPRPATPPEVDASEIPF